MTESIGPATVEAIEIRGKRPKWSVSFFKDGLRGERADGGSSFHVLRRELQRQVQIHDFGFLRRTLVVKKPRRTLQFAPEAFTILTDWVGSEELLRLALRQRLAWTLPIGFLFVLTSLPLPGDPAAGVAALPFNPVSAALGFVLVVQGMASRRWPHPVYFLLDSLWFLGLAVQGALGVARGGSPLWLALNALQVSLAFTGFSAWNRFRGLRARR